MRRTRVKICGITSPEDAAMAVSAGADALGVVFAPSPRQVTVEQAARILADVPPLVGRVGVFVDADEEFIERAVHEAGLTAVQLHGGETPAQCKSISIPVIKVCRVGTEFVVDALEPFRGQVSALLLDKLDSQAQGGTGKTFNWQAITELPEWAPYIVAGGLTPENVRIAIRTLRPFGVDVSSGVETSPGRKDPDKIAAFVAEVRAADSEVGE